MRSRVVAIICTVIVFLLAQLSTLAVTNGKRDGTAHPAVGYLLASIGPDFCRLSNQAAGCSGVLIAPDLILTSGECTHRFLRALATGVVDRVWVDFNPDTTTDCDDFVPVDTGAMIPHPAFDPDAPLSSTNNVGVWRLAASQQAPAVTLPQEGIVDTLAPDQAFMAVAYGSVFPFDNDADVARRYASARLVTLQPEGISLRFDPDGDFVQPACVGFQNEGGGVFLGATNEVVATILEEVVPGCSLYGRHQRLDLPGVRGFLAQFVSLP